MSARTIAATEPANASLLNRELSDLAFIGRVLEEAENTRHPVLERLKFLAITGALLEEFYRIRVTAIREQIRRRVTRRSPDGLDPYAQLRAADRASDALMEKQSECWQRLVVDLRKVGVSLPGIDELTSEEIAWLRGELGARLAPRVAPLPVEPDRPLPFVKDGDIFVAVDLEDNGRDGRKALVPLPHGVGRFIALPGPSLRYIPLESALTLYLEHLFPGARIVASGLARVIREGDLKLASEVDDLELVRAALERRERAEVIRLEVDTAMPEHLCRFLARGLGLVSSDELHALQAANATIIASEFVAADRLLGLADMRELVDAVCSRCPRELSFPAVAPARPAFVGEYGGDLFAAIAAQDRLLHFPYDDFGVIQDFLDRAADDPDVVEIRQTLYRTGRDSAVVAALARAARRGARVTAVVELEAREDERENADLAERLADAGAAVSLGLPELKVHVKALLVVRRERGALRGYVNFATGNYHAGTARAYTDLSLLCARPDLVADAEELFAYLTTGAPPRNLRRIALAPHGLRATLLELVAREAAHAARGRPAGIWLKLNKLSDPELIAALYRASQQGVDIRIVVRGVCCLRPGVPGLSERIRVKSVVGRFLEHSRILCFGNGHGLPSEAAEVFLSSADWMQHKLDRRVEALVPLEDAAAKRYVQRTVMAAYLDDEAQSWRLQPDGVWVRETAAGFSAQAELMAAREAFAVEGERGSQ